MDVKTLLPMNAYAQPLFQACSACRRTKALYYRLTVFDPNQPSRIVGGLDLCKRCGEALAEITGQTELPLFVDEEES